MNDRMCFCWYQGHLFVGPLSTVNGLQPLVEYDFEPAILAILSDGGVEISRDTAEAMGWNLY